MRVAVPIWNGRVSPVFDTAQRILICDLAGAQVLARREEKLSSAPAGRVAQLTGNGIDTLICGAISRPLADLVASAGMRLIPFVAGEPDDVVTAFVEGRLMAPGFLMPGCCGRGMRFRGGQGNHRRGCRRT